MNNSPTPRTHHTPPWFPVSLRLTLTLLLVTTVSACLSGEERGESDDDDDGVADSGQTTPGRDAGIGTTDDAGVTTEDASDTTGEDASTTECAFPQGSGALTVGEVWPELSWEAYLADGETIELDMNALFCDPSEDAYASMVFVVGAGWCPYCPDYIRWVDTLATSIEANNSLLVYMEMENASSQLEEGAAANAFINSLGVDSGLRVGDADTQPNPGTFSGSREITGLPTAYVVRFSDMAIIADQNVDPYYLDLAGLTANPEDVSVGGTVEANCGEEEEEASEPNDMVQDAAGVGEETIEGGLCTNSKDFFNIELAGDWELLLEFSHELGDLNVFVWDLELNQPATDPETGERLGSFSDTDDEVLAASGPMTLVISGRDNATAPYVLTVTAN